MAGLYDHPEGALTKRPLSAAERRKLQAAMLKMDVKAANAGSFGAPAAAQGALAGANVRQNPGTEMGPAQATGGYGKSFAKEAMLGMLGGFGGGPFNIARTIGQYAMNPSTFADTGVANIGGLGPIAFSPGPTGPMLDVTGFGALARAAGRLNAGMLRNIAATDPSAVAMSGRGWGGFFHDGVYSGTLPGGLEASTRRAMIQQGGQLARAMQRDRDRYGRDPGPDPRKGGGSRPEGGMGRRV